MSIEKYITGSEKLTSIYGSWPTFHDAEVLQITLCRDEDLRPEKTEWNGPSLTAKFHLFIEAPTSRETITTVRFGGIEDLRLEGFNHQKAILSLRIDEDPTHARSSLQYRIFGVKIEEAFGISASFHCHTIEVLEASPTPN
jgi:hypothetical protein